MVILRVVLGCWDGLDTATAPSLYIFSILEDHGNEMIFRRHERRKVSAETEGTCGEQMSSS